MEAPDRAGQLHGSSKGVLVLPNAVAGVEPRCSQASRSRARVSVRCCGLGSSPRVSTVEHAPEGAGRAVTHTRDAIVTGSYLSH